jgi:glutathione S-transferase
MKLYFSPGACSLSAHITAREADIDLVLERVDIKNKKLRGGGDFLAINPKGYVPALELDDGQILTEVAAIVQYLADLRPATRLAPPSGTMARYRLQEMLAYLSSEIHKSYSPLFYATTSPEVRAEKVAILKKRYALIESTLAGKTYLFGDDFTVADAYLFTVTDWAHKLKVDLSELANVAAFQARVAERPAVHAAMKAEGLIT